MKFLGGSLLYLFVIVGVVLVGSRTVYEYVERDRIWPGIALWLFFGLVGGLLVVFG